MRLSKSPANSSPATSTSLSLSTIVLIYQDLLNHGFFCLFFPRRCSCWYTGARNSRSPPLPWLYPLPTLSSSSLFFACSLLMISSMVLMSSVCHNKNDALILVFPKISASLSDKKRHLNGLYCVSCYSVPKTGRQRIYNHFCSFSELKKSFHLRLFLKSGARLGIMPKELKGLPYRISFKILQIYGNNFIRAPFA